MSSARGAALWVVAAVAYLALEAVAAASFHPHYSYARNYISDLGLPGSALVRGRAVDSPRAGLMHAAFSVQGTLFFFGALLMVANQRGGRRGDAFLGAVGANAIGNAVIASVHSGAVHVGGAVLAIAGGNVAIALGSTVIEIPTGSRFYGCASKGLAALGLSCFVVLAVRSTTGHPDLLPDGVWERGSVYSITVWQLVTGAWLLTAWASRAARRSGSPRRPGARR